MARIISDEIKDFNEMTIIPAWTPSGVRYKNADISVRLTDDIELTYPFVSAAMTSVVNKEFAESVAKNGMMATIPTSLRIDDAADIVKHIKSNEHRRGDLEVLKNPTIIRTHSDVNNRPNRLKDAVSLYEEVGHSVIPVCDKQGKLQGLFRYQEGIPHDYLDMDLIDMIDKGRKGSDRFIDILKPFDRDVSEYGLDYAMLKDGKDKVQQMISERSSKYRKGYMPIVSADGTLKGLAFKYKHKGSYIAAAIHTYDWKRRAEALIGEGVDMLVIDSSDGATDYVINTIKGIKDINPHVPVCAGNVVSGEALKKKEGSVIDVKVYDELVNAGADIVKVGMGGGRICVTTDNRGVGRGTLKALNDVYHARDASTYRKVPIIGDGGIGTFDPDMDKRAHVKKNMRQDSRSINISFGFNDAVMMGSYFNMFEEAAGPGHIIDGVKYKESWGEGSMKAKSFARYGVDEGVKRANIEEGTYNKVPCLGTLKPGVEKTALNLAMTMTNVGARNLSEYRDLMVLDTL